MPLERSTSAPGADAHATSIEQRTSEYIRTTVSALEQRITEQILAVDVALVAHIHAPTTAPAITSQQQSILPDATPTTEGGKEDLAPPIDLLDDEPQPTESEFVDFAYYGEVIPASLEGPPRDVEEPRL
jgi:hypothetical protein